MLVAIAFVTFFALGGVVSAWLSAAVIRRLGLPWRETLVWFGILLEPEIAATLESPWHQRNTSHLRRRRTTRHAGRVRAAAAWNSSLHR